MKVDLLIQESPERITEIWNEYHSSISKTTPKISGVMDSEFFVKFKEQGKKYPMVKPHDFAFKKKFQRY